LSHFPVTSKLHSGSQSSFYCPRFHLQSLPYCNYCTTIAQYTPPHWPPVFMPYTISYWLFKYRVQANLSIAIDVSSYAIILTTDTFCYLDCICWISNGVVLVLFTQSFCCCLPGDSLLGTPPRYCDWCRCLRDGSYNGLIFYFDFIRCQTFFFFFLCISHIIQCVLLSGRRLASRDTTSVLRSMSLPTPWAPRGTSATSPRTAPGRELTTRPRSSPPASRCAYIYVYLSIYLSLYIYVYTYTYMFTYIMTAPGREPTTRPRSSTPASRCAYIYVYISLYLSLYIYIYVYTYIYVYIYYDRIWKGTDHAASLEPTGLTVCIYICISIYLSLYIYIHICIHIHICLHILWPNLEGNWPRGLAEPTGLTVCLDVYIDGVRVGPWPD